MDPAACPPFAAGSTYVRGWHDDTGRLYRHGVPTPLPVVELHSAVADLIGAVTAVHEPGVVVAGVVLCRGCSGTWPCRSQRELVTAAVRQRPSPPPNVRPLTRPERTRRDRPR